MVMYYHGLGKSEESASVLIVDKVGNGQSVSGRVLLTNEYKRGVKFKEDPTLTPSNVSPNGCWDWPSHVKAEDTKGKSKASASAKDSTKTEAPLLAGDNAK